MHWPRFKCPIIWWPVATVLTVQIWMGWANWPLACFCLACQMRMAFKYFFKIKRREREGGEKKGERKGRKASTQTLCAAQNLQYLLSGHLQFADSWPRTVPSFVHSSVGRRWLRRQIRSMEVGTREPSFPYRRNISIYYSPLCVQHQAKGFPCPTSFYPLVRGWVRALALQFMDDMDPCGCRVSITLSKKWTPNQPNQPASAYHRLKKKKEKRQEGKRLKMPPGVVFWWQVITFFSWKHTFVVSLYCLSM